MIKMAKFFVTIWKEHLNKVGNNGFLKLSNAKTKVIQCISLTTCRFTEITKTNFFKVRTDAKFLNTMFCPNILNIKVSIYLI